MLLLAFLLCRDWVTGISSPCRNVPAFSTIRYTFSSDPRRAGLSPVCASFSCGSLSVSSQLQSIAKLAGKHFPRLLYVLDCSFRVIQFSITWRNPTVGIEGTEHFSKLVSIFINIINIMFKSVLFMKIFTLSQNNKVHAHLKKYYQVSTLQTSPLDWNCVRKLLILDGSSFWNLI